MLNCFLGFPIRDRIHRRKKKTAKLKITTDAAPNGPRVGLGREVSESDEGRKG